MSIAYLIQAHDNYQHLQRLIDALQAPNIHFYIHIDRKSAMPLLTGANIIFIEQRINVHWGGFSQVQATLFLMEKAMESHHDYFAFISGKDYPIKPNAYLLHKLKEGGEYIHLQKMGEDPYAPLSRYKYYYFTDHYNRRDKHSIRTRFFLWFQQMLRQCRLSKQIPFSLYTGASWFVLSKPCVEMILQTAKERPAYIQFFRSGFCPDESFFQTIIGNSVFRDRVNGYLTYADWSVNPGPAVINETHLAVLIALQDKFFARKFTDDSYAVVERIEKELRSDQRVVAE